MTKVFKYSRKEIIKNLKHTAMLRESMGLDTELTPLEDVIDYLLATKPESDKEKCLHDHLCCPGDIKTVRCAYCGKSMYHEPQEELEVEELGKGKWEYRFNGTGEWMTLGNNLTEITDKLNSLIKAHNALVKEVRKQ